VHLDDVLVDLKLTPDVLEVPVPRYFIESRTKVGSSRLERSGAALTAVLCSQACGRQ
jgi:hypothetical protein